MGYWSIAANGAPFAEDNSVGVWGDQPAYLMDTLAHPVIDRLEEEKGRQIIGDEFINEMCSIECMPDVKRIRDAINDVFHDDFERDFTDEEWAAGVRFCLLGPSFPVFLGKIAQHEQP